jgi:HPt (histidine-containing phosphotransfer) domain-containing protein
MAELEASLQRNDVDSARRTLHTLEGISGNIGAHTLQQAAKDLHSKLSKDSVSRTFTLPQAFNQAFAQLFKEIRCFLADLTIPLNATVADAIANPTEAEITIDKLITSLDDMLAAGNPDAKSLFQTLHQTLNQQNYAEITDRLMQQIRDYDFDLARETLASLSEHLRNR